MMLTFFLKEIRNIPWIATKTHLSPQFVDMKHFSSTTKIKKMGSVCELGHYDLFNWLCVFRDSTEKTVDAILLRAAQAKDCLDDVTLCAEDRLPLAILAKNGNHPLNYA